jgi:hypothetical protein
LAQAGSGFECKNPLKGEKNPANLLAGWEIYFDDQCGEKDYFNPTAKETT